MELESLIESAAASGASDLHLESRHAGGVARARRVARHGRTHRAHGRSRKWRARSSARSNGRFFWSGARLTCRKTIRGVRCRINILQTSRGVGLAIRLLSAFQATVEKLNLHPDLKKLVKNTHGLILVSGPTGCGKSSTLAALIQEINLTETRHIITVESPIEYHVPPAPRVHPPARSGARHAEL